MMKILEILSTLILVITIIMLAVVFINALTSCTYSINMIHSEGSATDMIDENQTADPNINPNLTIPLKGI